MLVARASERHRAQVGSAFEQIIVATDEDVDELGHVSNLAYVRWVLSVARAHCEHQGWDLRRWRELGAVFVVRRHEVDYLRPAYADDTIVARTWIERFKGATAVRRTALTRTGDGVEVACAKTTWALVSTTDGRPYRIPVVLRDSFVSATCAQNC